MISTFGLAITLVLEFTIPVGWSDTMKYAYFFIVYVVLNAVFYTAFGIAHSALISLITKNTNERVQISSIRTMFGFVAAIVLSSITMVLVNGLGGGAAGWRNTAIVYAVLCILLNLLTVASVRELSGEELDRKQMEKTSEQKAPGLLESLKTLIKNKYYVMILVINVCIYLNTAIYTAVGAYYTQYILGNPAMLGSFVIVSMLPMAISVAFTPVLVKKVGSIYKVNVIGYAFSIIFSIFYVVAGYMGNVTLMLVMLFLSGLGAGPLTGNGNALTSIIADYTYKTTGKKIEGSIFSCASIGIKVGSGLGSVICGWLLGIGGYVPNAAQQPQGAINAINFMYLWIPLILRASIGIICYFLNVEKANADWDAAHAVSEK